ncbi:uncharacterized protein LOC113218818 [Apis mellifera]|uniref:Uncharacterized protein LOC113218818 n=1 Tax=Apis mellifera TaxID=7460 RepID=A0A7M7L3A1_APIME|nr:uncharacterized protein LOC113218818 [Apis mellifera]|eukprot:XP_026296907.1 uncharacterized protein LOC113218818 [Apis mellifera]
MRRPMQLHYRERTPKHASSHPDPDHRSNCWTTTCDSSATIESAENEENRSKAMERCFLLNAQVRNRRDRGEAAGSRQAGSFLRGKKATISGDRPPPVSVCTDTLPFFTVKYRRCFRSIEFPRCL